jgi:hypothetical protein
MRRRSAPWLLVLSVFAWSGCALLPPDPPRDLPPGWQVQRIHTDEIDESSGLVASRTHPGVFWTHNDSGDDPRIFAINGRGDLIVEFPVLGATLEDWEDITIDDAGNLYIGDIGNNKNERDDLRVYRVPEPDPFAGSRTARVDLVLPFRYADQKEFPDSARRNFDAEALFWMEGDLYLLTKHRSDTHTKLYRLLVLDGGLEQALLPIARFDLGGKRRRFFGNATAAALRSDGKLMAVLTYRAIHLFERTPDGDKPFRLLRRIELDERSVGLAESIAWNGDSLIFGNEQGYLYPIPDPLADGLERYPPDLDYESARVNGKSRHRRQTVATGISSQGALAR